MTLKIIRRYILPAIVIIGAGVWLFYDRQPKVYPTVHIVQEEVTQTSTELSESEASNLGLSSGAGEYYKYVGSFEIKGRELAVEDIIYYQTYLVLEYKDRDDIVLHYDLEYDPDGLTKEVIVVETGYIDFDYESANLTVVMMYHNEEGAERQSRDHVLINIE